jgi:hypothetical protein
LVIAKSKDTTQRELVKNQELSSLCDRRWPERLGKEGCALLAAQKTDTTTANITMYTPTAIAITRD